MLRGTLARVMELQPAWSAENTEAMQERGHLVRTAGPEELNNRIPALQPLFPAGAGELAANGRDGTGRKTEIPWFRLASAELSPNARIGFYLVYLFDAAGESATLSLIQGTTTFDGGQFVPLPPPVLAARVAWARAAISDSGVATSRFESTIALKSERPLAGAYERGTVYAISYDYARLPAETTLDEDLQQLSEALAAVYRYHLRGQPPGELPAEVEHAERGAADAAGRRRPRAAGFLPNAEQRAAVEQRAMAVARMVLETDGWSVRDVSVRNPYDYAATCGADRLHIEVKGTTSDGALVTLTEAEVNHARDAYPETALIVVSGIRLNGTTAEGGEPRTVRPWYPSDESLTAISHRYAVPVSG